MDFREKIKTLRIQQGLTLEAVGRIVGVGKSTVRKWESGEIANMGRDKIALLAEALHVTPGYLMGWESDPVEASAPASYPGIEPITQSYRLPLLGPVAAGEPIQVDPEDAEYVNLPYHPGKADAALKVEGDSMQPRYLDGDIVFIRYQDDVEDGQIAAVCIDDRATLKRVYHIRDGVQLVSENAAYPPMIFTTEDANNIHVVGLAVGYMRWER